LALREAANRLFAERGFEQTPVRDIAAAAGVTERTFYRYFDGKEGLFAEETLAWIEVVERAIRERPASEPPLAAIEAAFLSVASEVADAVERAPLWLFRRGERPFRLLHRIAPRPMLRIERAMSDALLSRGGGFPDREQRFEAELASRVALATLRSVLIDLRRNQAQGGRSPLSLEAPLEHAFAALRRIHETD
jgi:AcrR family transcriptional regulator